MTVLLSLMVWFNSCQTIQTNVLMEHKQEIINIIDLTCKDCVILGPVKAEGKRVAISVISVITGKPKYQTIIIDFETMDYVRILTPNKKYNGSKI